MSKNKRKEDGGVLDAIVDAAKTNLEFAKQGAASAATNLTNALTGEMLKPKSRSKRSPNKKSASKARRASTPAKHATKSAKKKQRPKG